jgi:glutamate formiminotransferase
MEARAPTLLAVPNFSEGRDGDVIEAVSGAFAGVAGVELLDRHSDSIHNRTVLTLAGEPGRLGTALVSGAAACVARIDLNLHDGAHPRVGALDVCPVVHLSEAARETARSEALAVAAAIGGMRVPVFLYGALASDPQRRERALFSAGGP